MLQDNRGFLWLGTREGLNCFDGYRFKNFFSEKDPAAGLADNFVSDLLEYQPGQLLIATANGLSVLNTFTGNFENDKIKFSSLRAGAGVLIGSLFKDKSGKIWINHSGELDVLDSNLNYIHRFTDLPWAQSIKGIRLRAHAMMQDKQERLWLPGDTTGIQILDVAAKQIYNSKNNPFNYPFLTKEFTRSLMLDEINNCLWYGPWGKGLIKYDFKTSRTEQIRLGNAKLNEDKSVNAIRLASSNKIFCLTGTNFFEVNTSNYLYNPVNLNGNKQNNSTPDIIFHTIFYSSDNQYWVGASNGLWQLKNEESFLRKLTINLNPENSEEPISTGIGISPNGKLYVGFALDGLVEIEQNRSDYQIYDLNKISQANITRIYADDEGPVWIGTTSGLLQFDPVTKKFTKPALLPPDLDTGHIASINKNTDGTLWVSTRGAFGVWRRKKDSRLFERIDNDVLKKFSSLGINSRISEFIEDDKKNTWMISRLGGGIIRYNESNNQWLYFPEKRESKALLADIGLEYINPGKNNNLWIIDVLGNGLIEYYYLKDSIVKYTRNDGLPSSIIRSVCNDEKDNLWIATDYGLSLFDKNKHKVISTAYYTHSDKSVYHRLLYDKFSGNIIVVLNNNLFFFNEASTLSFADAQPVPLIEDLFVNNVKTAITNEIIKLNSSQKNITIAFTAVQYLNANKIKFAYRLDGADNDWKQSDAARTANYSLLSPGNYRFFLKTTDANGKWGPEHKLVEFTIVPQFWQTYWFKISAVLLLIAGCWLLVRRRIKNIRHEAELKQKIAETEMMALRAQMNPHFIFNCINSIDAMIQSNDKYQATVYLNKFAKLIRNILDSSKQNLVPLSKDIETLQLYVDLEMFRNENKFKAEINADAQLLRDDYQVPPLIIQPYVENAILHGLRQRDDNNGKLVVTIQKQNGTLTYEIMDNGVGRTKNPVSSPIKKTNGYGMQISEDRVRLFNKEEKASVVIRDLHENDQSSGTCVTVQLKIQ